MYSLKIIFINMDLKDKVAIVTGAKQGIGLGIVKVLSGFGAKVVVSDIDQDACEKVVRDLGIADHAIALACDVSDREQVDTLIKKTVEKYGKLDIIVNNAGIYPFIQFEKMTEADWDKVMNVNLKGIFNTTKSSLKVMNDGSKIINISSIASFVGFEGLTHYCATKGALNSFTRALALELAPRKINVNNVAPGAIDTPGATGAVDPSTKKSMTEAIPWKRYGEPEDIANAVAFLASSLSDYITGQTIVVDGGWTIK
jgi:NAD(P)-dependent dehydrogenase (short-subunit alcohol dehydrogenase family)